MDIGLATSTPPVDHEPAAGSYAGTGRFGRVRTSRTAVIFSLLFSAWNGSCIAFARSRIPSAVPAPNARKFRRSMVHGLRLFEKHGILSSTVVVGVGQP